MTPSARCPRSLYDGSLFSHTLATGRIKPLMTIFFDHTNKQFSTNCATPKNAYR